MRPTLNDDNSSQNQQSSSSEESVIRGVVKRIVFRNAENGYTVLRLGTSSSEEELTVVGNFLSVSIGMHLILRGKTTEHDKYGKQFNSIQATQTQPSSPQEIEQYLSSGLIKGIGPKTAERIIEAFGSETIEMIEQHPEEIAKVSGVGSHKAQLIHEALVQQKDEKETMRFLIEHQVSPLLAQKIYKLYGTKTVEKISENPYRLAQDIWGVGFATADSIAMNFGIELDSPLRLKAGILFTLEKAAESDGHCYLPDKLLSERARVLLAIEDRVDLTPYVSELENDGDIIRETDANYLPSLYRAESYVAEFCSRRVSELEEPKVSKAVIDSCIRDIENQQGISFSAEQKNAIELASKFPLLVITGGPGCGKTTIIQAISGMYKEAGHVVRLAAPTGRAAQRMSQVCDMSSSTIHRMLKFDPITKHFIHGPKDPILADVIIIDEASMIDIKLAMSLFSAISKNTVVILVGDKDQLPSVGPGRVLSDLLSLVELQSVSLNRIFRRSNESSINDIAHAINCGQVPDIPVPDGETKTDAYFLPKSEPEEAAALIERLISDQIPKKFNIPQADITVLTPSNRGPLGTLTLNKKLQQHLNPSGKIDIEQEMNIGETDFRIGDRVCQRVNNYNIDESGVFNGDVGTIYSIDRSANSLTVELWDGRLIDYSKTDLSQLSLAYAVTVHRSQGSEIPCVVLALHDSHYTLLERQLIYTAITRAKKLLIIVGSKRAFSMACKRTNTSKRCTKLAERVKELCELH